MLLESIGGKNMYNKILVPLDGSEFGECVLPHVKRIAQGCQVSKVILFHVIEPLSAQNITALAQTGGDTITRVEQDIKTDAEKYTRNVTTKVTSEGINAIPVLLSGDASEEILKYAADNNVDMIIMSTHGRSGISRFFMGSVADKVVHHSTVPIMLVPPAGCRM
jgi:nucleotide-binding universal stress UspA family protein